MEPYTLGRDFHKRDIIDGFYSLIWTERYQGDSEVEIVVPVTTEMITKLPVGTLLGLDGTDEVMILETMNIESGNLKLTGIALLPWLNNRFIRTTPKHEDKYWYISGQKPGQVLWTVVNGMCVAGSPYLNGSINIGIANPQQLVVPGLTLKDYDKSGVNISVAVPFGPLYDAIKEIATTYEIGMQITLESVTDTSYILGFRSYKGLDRTSGQTENPVVRFSPQMDSFTDIKELQSIAALKTLAYAFAPENPGGLATGMAPGTSSLTDSTYSGFDLRAILVFADDITTDLVGTSATNLKNVLTSRAKDALTANKYVKAVDGEIVPDNQFKYGIHYTLGDLIEVQGNTGVVQTARITEYIRAQDASGEKAYPTVAMIG